MCMFYLKFCFICCFYIFYLVSPVCSLTLKIDGQVELLAGTEFSYKINGVSLDKYDTQRRTGEHVHNSIPNLKPLYASDQDLIVLLSESDTENTDFIRRTTPKQWQPFIKETTRHYRRDITKSTDSNFTSHTTKYEMGTTKGERRDFVLRSHRKKKKKHSRDNVAKSEKKHGKKYTRLGDYEYVYLYFKNDTASHKVQPIIYNKTHYVYYTSEIPNTYYNLYKLWEQSGPAKLFDKDFTPPWWMQFHKPPYWMHFHDHEVKGGDTWDIFHEFHSKADDPPTTPGIVLPGILSGVPSNLVGNSLPNGLSKWLTNIWDKLQVKKVQESNGTNFIDVSFTIPELWHNQRSKIRRNVPLMLPLTMTSNASSQVETQSNEYKEDISLLNKQILNHTFKLFEVVNKNKLKYNRTKDLGLSMHVDKNNFRHLRETRSQRAKSEVDTEVMNAINSSNRMAIKLVDLLIGDLEKKGLLESKHKPITKKEFKQEMKWEVGHACEKLGLCKPTSDFVQFILDILDFVLSLEQDKFKVVFVSFLDIFDYTDFSAILNEMDIASMHMKIHQIQNEITLMQRTKVLIVKNVIRKNTLIEKIPGSRDSDEKVRNAFIRLINILEEKVKTTRKNIDEWEKIRIDLNDWAAGAGLREDLQPILYDLVTHFKEILFNLDSNSLLLIARNFKLMVE